MRIRSGFIFVFRTKKAIPDAVVVRDRGAHLYQGGGVSAEHLNVQDFSL